MICGCILVGGLPPSVCAQELQEEFTRRLASADRTVVSLKVSTPTQRLRCTTEEVPSLYTACVAG